MITEEDARIEVFNFIVKYNGQTVHFEDMDGYDKFRFVLVDVFRFLHEYKNVDTLEALDRAKSVAERLRDSGYAQYPVDRTLTITD